MKKFAIFAALMGCPNLPPQTNCTPLTYQCVNDSPYVCSSSMRLERIGERSCQSVGAVCVVTDGGPAHCATVTP